MSFSRLSIALIVVGLCSVPARSADSARVGAYDFAYFLSGDARAKPVQVFDDGRSTYFQFRAGEAVPAIFAAQAGVPQLLVPAQEGPYVRVQEVRGRFLLQVGRAQANVIHGGGDRADAPQITAVGANGMTTPFNGQGRLEAGGRLVASLTPVQMSLGDDQALNRNSYATPVKGDKVFWPEQEEQVEHSIGFERGAYVLSRDAQQALAGIARNAAPSAKFIVIGRDDDSYKEGLERARSEALRNGLLKAGIPSERITLRTGVMKPAAHGKFWESTVMVSESRLAPTMALAPAVPGSAPALVNPAMASNVEALLRAGVIDQAQARVLLARLQPAATPLATAAQPVAPTAANFAMRKADESVDRMLTRWGKDSGWRVLWQSATTIPITGDAEVERPDFLQAADLVLKQAKAAGYKLQATAYSNKVLQIVGE